jgi:hypothetical protein
VVYMSFYGTLHKQTRSNERTNERTNEDDKIQQRAIK